VRELLAVALGGVVGTALRLGIDALIPHSDAAFPASTLIINLLGSFALGFLISRVWPTASGVTKAALGPGLLGSFTTFSALAVAIVTLVDSDTVLVAVVYLVVTVLGGYGAAFAGLMLGRPRAVVAQ
jgi:CrcB protein